jgi:hypothetical protein
VPGGAGVVRLQIEPGADLDAEELERLAVQLREELLELDVGSVLPVSAGPAPEGARAVEALAVGVMMITAVRSGAAVFSVVTAVRSWLNRNKTTRVRLTLNGHELEVDGLSSEAQERMITEWLARAAPAASG